MDNDPPEIAALSAIFNDCRPAAVAVSGGVDSMTLAFIAHRHMAADVTMFHAVSPAVPPAATERVRSYASKEGWALRTLNAGEFGDEKYLANPANRCFFCKSNLYGSLAKATDAQLLSGTNLDDLGDWRPGLEAAKNNSVRHPFVEAGINKQRVRAVARHFDLTDVAELPAAPCLSSRVETGIRIDAETLISIDRTECMLRDALKPETVRCRVRQANVEIQLDPDSLDRLDDGMRMHLAADIRQFFSNKISGKVIFTGYQRGSAFLRETLNV